MGRRRIVLLLTAAGLALAGVPGAADAAKPPPKKTPPARKQPPPRKKRPPKQSAKGGILVRRTAKPGFELHDTNGHLSARIPTGTVVPTTAGVYAPDGSSIAFVGDDRSLWVISSDGRKRRRLAAATVGAAPVWSRDGRFVAFQALDGRAAIASWPSGGVTETVVEGDRGFAFAPDGSVWIGSGDIQAHIQIRGVPAGGAGGPIAWGQPAPDDLWAGSTDAVSLAPGGGIAAYLRYEGTGSVNEALYEQPRGGAQQAIVVGPYLSHAGGSLAFSPDSSLIAVDWTIAQQATGQLWLIAAGGGAPVVVSPATELFAQPVWSPDSQRVAIQLAGGGVAVVGRSGSVSEPSGLRGALSPSWAPGPAGSGGGGGGGGGTTGGCQTSVPVTATITAVATCLQKERTRDAYDVTGTVRVNGVDFFANGGGTIVVNRGSRRVTAQGSGIIKIGPIPIGAWSHGDLGVDLAAGLRFTPLKVQKPGIFGFPITGSLDGGFTPTGASLHANVSLKILGDPVTGDVVLATDNTRGLHVGSLDITLGAAEIKSAGAVHNGTFCSMSKDPPKGFDCIAKTFSNGQTRGVLQKQSPAIVRLGGVLPIQGLFLHYDDSRHEWSGGGTIGLGGIFPGAKDALPSVTLGAGITVNPFAFNYGSVEVDNLNAPMGPVDLQKVKLNLHLRPVLDVGGGVGLTVGPKVDGKSILAIDSGFELKLGMHTGFDLKITGTVTLATALQLGSAYVEYDGRDGALRVNFGGTLGENFGPVQAQLVLTGTADRGGIQAVGTGQLQAFGVPVTGQAVLSNAGVGACGKVNAPFFQGSIGFRYLFASRQTQFAGCDFTGLFTAAKASAAAASPAVGVITVGRGRSSQEFAAVGASAPPQVELSGPGGVVLQTPAIVDRASITPGGFALAESATRTTYFIVERPRAGKWRLSPLPGTAAPVRFLRADPLRRRVSARVTGSGSARVLRWDFRSQPGKTVTFVERGAGVSRTLAVRARGHGSLRFSPAPGPGGRRAIVAIVEVDGVSRSQSRVANFRASATTVAAPEFAHVRQRGRVVTVSWASATGVSGYEVDVRLARHELRRFVVNGGEDSVTFGVARGVRVRGATVYGSRHGLLSPGRRASG